MWVNTSSERSLSVAWVGKPCIKVALKPMDEEKTLDLKTGEGEETPADIGQSEDETDLDSDEDEKVTLTKEEYDKLLKDKENYKKGLLAYKEKSKEQTPPAKESDALTKAEFQKINEKKAIKSFLESNPDANSQWDKLISFYRDSRGRSTVEDIVSDLDDAYTLFQKHNPAPEDKDPDKEQRATLSAEKSLSSTSRGREKASEKGGILTKKTPVTDWYK
jgi:hypothetical protein